MQLYNIHSHTFRCNHAEGTEREYIENAIKNGMRILGFSDHSPYFFEGDYYSHFRMKREETKDYVETLLKLKEEYKNDISIHIGMEAEYYPKYFGKLMDFLKNYPIEYLILGQHFLGNEMDSPVPCTRAMQDKQRLNEYADQVCEAISTGAFTCVAHPDVINYTLTDEASENAWRKICLCAKKYDVALEINLLGIRTARNYPRNDFWKVAGEVGNKVLLGSDAHTVKDVIDPSSCEVARNMALQYGLNLMEKPVFINPFGGNK